MSNATVSNLGREKIQQILAAVGSQKTDDGDKVESIDYNWQEPHYFSNNQLEELERFTENVAQNCTRKFSQLYHGDFNAAIVSTTQHFASTFSDSNDAKNDYYLTFGTKDQAFGLFVIPCKTAIIWASQLLGDTQSTEDSDRDLSQLEQSLLSDIASAVIDALSESYGQELLPIGEILSGQMPIELEDTKELCKIAFNVKKSDSENSTEAYFLILCDQLQSVAGEKIETSENTAAKDIPKAMFDYAQVIPVSITAQLASTVLTFEEIMSLQVDDILLLDKNVTESAELIIEGQTVFRGQLAKTDNNRAIVITELCDIK